MPRYDDADAVLDVARGFLTAAPEDRSGEDRTLVVVHVDAALLVDPDPDVPAGTPASPSPSDPTAAAPGLDAKLSSSPLDDSMAGTGEALAPVVGDVPAGTSGDLDARQHAGAGTATNPSDVAAEDVAHVPGRNVPAGTPDTAGRMAQPLGGRPSAGLCHIERVGSIEPATAARLACDATLLGAVLDADGDVLTLGRTRRLVSRAQRRALMVRDRMCRYPGCARTRHLHAHHIIPWSHGGPTDLSNLVLLCSWHHTAVHEGRLSIEAAPSPQRWRFLMPDGEPVRAYHDDDGLARTLQHQHDRHARDRETIAAVDGFAHPDARPIRPGWTGERFELAACVDVLFALQRPDPDTAPEPLVA